MARWKIMPAVAVVLLCAGTIRGQDALSQLEKRVVEHTLPNGMKFLILREEGAPVFSANITFRAGGVDEQPGITGLAHLYEHMAFKGTKTIGTTNYYEEKALLDKIDEVAVPLSNEIAQGDQASTETILALRKKLAEIQKQAAQFVVKDELWDTYLRHGASGLNASTGKDATRYYVSLPNNRLELWAWFESDRMMNPVLREFYQERDVVAEEHRLGIETSAGGTLYQDFIAVALIAHPGRYQTLGWMSDLQTVTRPDADVFFQKYYSPGNAVAAIVGEVDVEQVKEIANRYFGRLPARPAPPLIRTREPEQKGERRVKVVWDSQPELIIGYHKPDPKDEAEAVFEVIQAVLSRGRTSRLYRTLVQEKQIATSADTWTGPTERYENLFMVTATPRHPHTVAEVEPAIYEVLDSLIKNPPTEEELQKVRNNLRADLVKRMQDNSGMAGTLAYYQAVYGDWRQILRLLERVDKVTADDVKRVARTYLAPTNRTVGEIVTAVTPESQGESPKPEIKSETTTETKTN